MTLKIGIGLSFYNDFDSLQRMLLSCQSYPIDKIIAIDGKYEGYPSKQMYSDKEVLDLFKTSQTPYHIYKVAEKSQNEKRQAYFDAAKEHDLDVIIVMDSDEYFLHEKTNWPLFMDDLRDKIANHAHTYVQCYCIPTYLTHKGIEKMPDAYVENLPRVFHQPWKLTYVDDHYTIRNKTTGVIMTSTSNQVLEHIALGHDHTLRTKQYKANTKKYEEELVEYENSVRDKRRQEFSDNVYKHNHSG